MRKPVRPLGRIIREGFIGECKICKSSVKRLFGFGRILGCINPNCKNYFNSKKHN